MTREWQPGDVAAIRTQGNPHDDCAAVRTHRGDWNCAHGRSIPEALVTARPLVVIDPEDREQVERLGEALFGKPFPSVSDPREVERLQEDLREFANPTPPKCEAALSIEGKHFGCDQRKGHGMAHGNTEAGAIWGGDQ